MGIKSIFINIILMLVGVQPDKNIPINPVNSPMLKSLFFKVIFLLDYFAVNLGYSYING